MKDLHLTPPIEARAFNGEAYLRDKSGAECGRFTEADKQTNEARARLIARLLNAALTGKFGDLT